MKTYENVKFERNDSADASCAVLEGIELRRCYFQGHFISLKRDPSLRSTIRQVTLKDCGQRGCTIYTPIIEDVLVDGLKTHGQLLRTHGAVFNRVTLCGKIDRLMLSNDPLPSVLSDDAVRHREISIFRKANADYYAGVEWALDISCGEFSELCIRGIPANLVRRDPESQIVITRERALELSWKKLKFQNTIYATSLRLFLDRNEPSLILVAPKLHAKFPSHLADLALLRKVGVAVPD